MSQISPIEDFILKYTIPINGCFIWQRSIDGGGYGKITINGKTKSTHRLIYEAIKGNIPNNMLVCHTCDVRRCVNPSHLFLGTYKDNRDDMIKKNRQKVFVKLSQQSVKEIREKYKLGDYTHRRLAKEYNVSKSTIWDVLRYNHWTKAETPQELLAMKKERERIIQRGKKITKKIANQIRNQYAKGRDSQKVIAKKFGICQQTVYEIVNFKIWR